MYVLFKPIKFLFYFSFGIIIFINLYINEKISDRRHKKELENRVIDSHNRNNIKSAKKLISS